MLEDRLDVLEGGHHQGGRKRGVPVVKPGATFDFFAASRSVEVRCAEEVYGLIGEALAEGLGAKTRLGYGIVKLRQAPRRA